MLILLGGGQGQNSSGAASFGTTVVAAYSALISTAGGTLDSTSTSALITFVDTLNNAGIWVKLLEVWTSTGSNLAAALVKLKYPSAIQSSLTNNGFVSGDYTPTTGLQGGASKFLGTGFIPANQIASSVDFGFSLFIKNSVGNASNNINYFGCDTSNRVFSVFASTSLAATIVANSYSVASGIRTTCFVSANNLSMLSGYLKRDTTQIATKSVVTPGTLPSTEAQVYTYNGGTITQNARGIIYFYSIHTGLTDAESTTLYNAITTLNTSLGR
ncbi:MAG: hypothetical protein V7L31_20980 [Nostoc sp.]|uniref:hypothetical protein n=1 Tax=Nostoc sp. TaxID=1180 RepID=UPI002FF0DFBB